MPRWTSGYVVGFSSRKWWVRFPRGVLMKFDWIPDFDVRVTKGHVIIYVVITVLIFFGARYVYDMGHQDGWIECLNQHQHLIQWP